MSFYVLILYECFGLGVLVGSLFMLDLCLWKKSRFEEYIFIVDSFIYIILRKEFLDMSWLRY